MAAFMNSIILDCFLSFLISITLFALLLLTSQSALICMNVYLFISANVSEQACYMPMNTHMHMCVHMHICTHKHTQYTCWSHAEKICLPYSVLESIQNNKLPRERRILSLIFSRSNTIIFIT